MEPMVRSRRGGRRRSARPQRSRRRPRAREESPRRRARTRTSRSTRSAPWSSSGPGRRRRRGSATSTRRVRADDSFATRGGRRRVEDPARPPRPPAYRRRRVPTARVPTYRRPAGRPARHVPTARGAVAYGPDRPRCRKTDASRTDGPRRRKTGASRTDGPRRRSLAYRRPAAPEDRPSRQAGPRCCMGSQLVYFPREYIETVRAAMARTPPRHIDLFYRQVLRLPRLPDAAAPRSPYDAPSGELRVLIFASSLERTGTQRSNAATVTATTVLVRPRSIDGARKGRRSAGTARSLRTSPPSPATKCGRACPWTTTRPRRRPRGRAVVLGTSLGLVDPRGRAAVSGRRSGSSICAGGRRS